jgi:uncharacterized membrane protein HdeD (DUF308 family)
LAESISTMPDAFGAATLRDYPWWVMLVEGIAAVILGGFLFMNPVATTVTIVWFIAIYWVVTGLFSLISLFWDRSQWGWRLVWGIISVLAGWFIITDLLIGAFALLWIWVIIIAVQGIIVGVVQLIAAFKGGGWGRGALGALSLLIGVVLLAKSYIAVLALPYVAGALALIFGVLAIVGAFGLRKAQKAPLVMETVEAE